MQIYTHWMASWVLWTSSIISSFGPPDFCDTTHTQKYIYIEINKYIFQEHKTLRESKIKVNRTKETNRPCCLHNH